MSESYLDKITLNGCWALKECVHHGKAITILLITSRGETDERLNRWC